jgi:hypothetical protein
MPMPPREPIVTGDIRDQARLRPDEPARDLDEFLEFLGWIEAMFGRTKPPERLSTGEHFRL